MDRRKGGAKFIISKEKNIRYKGDPNKLLGGNWDFRDDKKDFFKKGSARHLIFF